MTLENISHVLLHGCNGEIEKTIPRLEGLLMSITIVLMIIISIFGNVLVIIAIQKYPKLRTLTNALLCSLAVVDLLTPITRLLSMSIAFIEEKWIFGCEWCQLSSVIGVFLCSASILHLCVISLERFITINHPMQRDRYITKNLFFVVVSLIWGISLTMSLLPYTKLVKMAFVPDLLDCAIFMVERPYLSVLLAISYFVLPFLLMVIVYSKIYRTVKIQTKQMSVYSVGSKIEKNKLKVRREWKAVKTVIVVIGLFFLLWIPYFIVSAVVSYQPYSVPGWLKRLTLFLGYLNSCCNWIVYCVRNKQLRHAFMRLLHLKSKDGVRKGRGLSIANANEDFFAVRRKYESQRKKKISTNTLKNLVICKNRTTSTSSISIDADQNGDILRDEYIKENTKRQVAFTEDDNQPVNNCKQTSSNICQQLLFDLDHNTQSVHNFPVVICDNCPPDTERTNQTNVISDNCPPNIERTNQSNELEISKTKSKLKKSVSFVEDKETYENKKESCDLDIVTSFCDLDIVTSL